MQLRVLLRHLRQHFLGRLTHAQFPHAAQPVFLDLGRHLGLAHHGYLVEHQVQVATELAAQAVVAQDLVEQHAGRVVRRVEARGHQVGLATVVEALRRAACATAALAQVGLARSLRHP